MRFDHMVENAVNAAKLYAEKTGHKPTVPKQRRKTPIKITSQGDVKLWHDYGYSVVGGPDAVCFYIDVDGRAEIDGWTKSDANCPVIFIGSTCADTDTIVEFPEFPGWRVHSTNDGKTLAVALVRSDDRWGDGMTLPNDVSHCNAVHDENLNPIMPCCTCARWVMRYPYSASKTHWLRPVPAFHNGERYVCEHHLEIKNGQ